jgi:hypothetical protein
MMSAPVARVFHLHRLDGGCGAHRHEGGRADVARFIWMVPVRALPLVAWIWKLKRVIGKRAGYPQEKNCCGP